MRKNESKKCDKSNSNYLVPKTFYPVNETLRKECTYLLSNGLKKELRPSEQKYLNQLEYFLCLYESSNSENLKIYYGRQINRIIDVLIDMGLNFIQFADLICKDSKLRWSDVIRKLG